MLVSNKKGFLLVDSLINVVIVASICLLCLVSFKTIDNYNNGYEKYIVESNEKYEYIFNSIGVCEKCVITSEDSSNLEP